HTFNHQDRSVIFSAGLFIWWVWMSSIANSVIFDDPRMIMAPIYYTFNTLIFVGIINLFNNKNIDIINFFRVTIVYSTLIILISQVILFDGSAVRQRAAFNNPNQMAHYVLLLLCC